MKIFYLFLLPYILSTHPEITYQIQDSPFYTILKSNDIDPAFTNPNPPCLCSNEPQAILRENNLTFNISIPESFLPANMTIFSEDQSVNELFPQFINLNTQQIITIDHKCPEKSFANINILLQTNKNYEYFHYTYLCQNSPRIDPNYIVPILSLTGLIFIIPYLPKIPRRGFQYQLPLVYVFIFAVCMIILLPQLPAKILQILFFISVYFQIQRTINNFIKNNSKYIIGIIPFYLYVTYPGTNMLNVISLLTFVSIEMSIQNPKKSEMIQVIFLMYDILCVYILPSFNYQPLHMLIQQNIPLYFSFYLQNIRCIKIGLGDIVIPGLTTKKNKGAILGYLIGLSFAFFVNMIQGRGQPGLLFILPCVWIGERFSGKQKNWVQIPQQDQVQPQKI